MGSPTEFEYEVFVSYAHLDNRPLPDKEKGWITQFTDLLDNLLGQELGSDPKIWRDNMLRGNDFITEAILMNLPRIAVMVSVISPRYLKSEWCQRELTQFCEAAKATGGFRIGNKSRIYKVIKNPVKREEEPETLRDVKGYEFFQVKEDGGRPLPFAYDEEFGKEARISFLNKVGDVAYDIFRLIEVLREQAAAQQQAAAAEDVVEPDSPTVYLAEPTPDLADEHDSIKRDLLQRKYRVLPEQPLPPKAADLVETALADLKRSDLSVHLIGKEYGASPQGDMRSYPHLLYTLAAERQGEAGFSRLVWMPRGGNKSEHIGHRTLVKEVENSSGNTDFLQTSLEDFKTIIQDKLKGQKSGAPKEAATAGTEAGGAPLVYISCDKLDLGTVGLKALESYLNSCGYGTVLRSTDAEGLDARREHEARLKECDAVLVYWSEGTRHWLFTNLDDLQKIFGYGRSKPLLARAIYITGEATAEKERFRSLDMLVAKNFGESSLLVLEEKLGPFTQEIDREMEGQVRENF